MENTKRMEELKKQFMAWIEPHIEEGIEFIIDFYTSNGGYMRDSFYHIRDGKKSKEGMNEIRELLNSEGINALIEGREDSADEIIKISPSYRKIRFRIVKGQDLIVEVVNPKELIEDIKRTQLKWIEQKNLDKVIDKVEYTECDYDKNKTTCIINEQSVSREGTQLSEYSLADKDYEYLYYTLDRQINELRVEVTKDNIIIQADKAFPELGIELIQKEVVADIDGNDIKKVYEYIESGDEQKIRKAVEVIKDNSELKSNIEKRYLNLIRARLNNPDAAIEDMSKDILTEKDRRTFRGDYIRDSFISYSYMSDAETKMIVDFIGAMVKNHLDIEEFIKKAKETTSENELKSLFDTYSSMVREGIQNEVKNYKEGWYGEICSKFLTMELEKVMFEKTEFTKANESLVLREYMFFLGMVAKGELYLDIHQSDRPDLTEVFWMLKDIPRTNWSDEEPKFPHFPLDFKRDGITKEGDMGAWRKIFDGFPSFEACKYYNLGYHAEEDDIKKAIEYYTRSIEHGEDGRTYCSRGLAYSDLKEHEKAFSDFKQATELGYDAQHGFYVIGKNCYKDKNYEQAAEYFTGAINCNPKHEDYYYRGICNNYLGNNRQALDDINSAIELGGEQSKYLSFKETLLLLQDKIDE